MNTQKTGKVMLLCLLAILSVGQTTTPERSLDGLPLKAEVGQLRLYSADGNRYILAHGNAIVATRIKVDGQDEFSAFDRGFLAHVMTPEGNP